MQTWIVGNWKQNPSSLAEVNNLATSLKNSVNQLTNTQQGDFQQGDFQQSEQSNVMVIPSTLHLSSVIDVVKDVGILVGCQDISNKNATVGAYTGDCSAKQMLDAGVKWTLVGHSERRQYNHESSEVLMAKIKNAFEQGLGVVYCIGETLESYEQGKTIQILQEQLMVIKMFADLAHLPNLEAHLDKIIIAYEPVWAIGTGKIPTIEEVELVNQQIRDYLVKVNAHLINTPVLYGGSVNADNAELFASSKWINGALIGGASLHADKFLNIADTFFKIKSKA